MVCTHEMFHAGPQKTVGRVCVKGPVGTEGISEYGAKKDESQHDHTDQRRFPFNQLFEAFSKLGLILCFFHINHLSPSHELFAVHTDTRVNKQVNNICNQINQHNTDNNGHGDTHDDGIIPLENGVHH